MNENVADVRPTDLSSDPVAMKRAQGLKARPHGYVLFV